MGIAKVSNIFSTIGYTVELGYQLTSTVLRNSLILAVTSLPLVTTVPLQVQCLSLW